MDKYQPRLIRRHGFVLLMSSVAYFILARCLVASHGNESCLAKALGADRKGKISTVLYAIAIPLTLWSSYAALFLYVFVEIMWIVPDRRVEKVLKENC
jgi:uncharacterized membrane protein